MKPLPILTTHEITRPPGSSGIPLPCTLWPSVYECWSQSLSFANARNRCESPFFFTFSISAYVSPMYSKMGSQPKVARQ